MECHFCITERRYGPTVYLAPAGELDCDAGPVWDGVEGRIEDTVDVVVCDMGLVGFMDLTGLTRLIAFAEALHARGTVVFVVNLRTQPAFVMDVFDEVEARRKGLAGALEGVPTAALRRTLTDRAAAIRARAGTVDGRLPVRPAQFRPQRDVSASPRR
ncbi:STAS domain-containing protein [Streptomyces sp. LARHCF249]